MRDAEKLKRVRVSKKEKNFWPLHVSTSRFLCPNIYCGKHAFSSSVCMLRLGEKKVGHFTEKYLAESTPKQIFPQTQILHTYS